MAPLRERDAEPFLRYRSRPEVARYQSWAPASLAEAKAFIQSFRSIEFDTPDTWFQLGVRLADSGELVGDLGAHFLARETRQAEIGFTIAPAFQRQGIGTEAVRGLLGHLFGPLEKHRVIASVDPRNLPSMALLERVGMRQEAFFRQSLWFDGEWADDVIFALLSSEWVASS